MIAAAAAVGGFLCPWIIKSPTLFEEDPAVYISEHHDRGAVSEQLANPIAEIEKQ